MDTSGDGKIGTEELAFGFKEILGVTLEDDELNKLMDFVDADGNKYIDFPDFLIASVTTEKQKLKEYCRNAYELFFKNEKESIEVSDLIEILCISNVMKPDFIRTVIHEIDDDDSQIVSAQEFYTFLIKKLGLDEGIDDEGTRNLTVHEIQKFLEETFHDVGQSGTWDHQHEQVDGLGSTLKYGRSVVE